MRAMVLEGFGRRLTEAQVPKPDPGPGEVLLRVRACGVCQTDLKIQKGGHASSPRVVFPHIPGHEVSGVVEELGPGTTGLSPGDPVVVNIYDICGECEYCRSGRESLCVHLGAWIGFDSPGGMAEYVRVPARNVVLLPRHVAPERAAILGDAIATSVRAVKTRGEVRPGQTVLITGAGGVGLHAVQVARGLGARVIAADISASRLQLARHYGAETVEPGTLVPDAVRALTGGAGADVALDFTGLAAPLAAAAASLRPGGRLVMVGYQLDTSLTVPTQTLVISELEVRGSRYCNRREFEEAVDLVGRGAIEPVVAAVMPLEQANEALDLLRSGQADGRVVLKVSD
ncbi:MAG: alcohol dehydrogenase catalytic domain-containing protein [Bacillota bacterium]